MHTHLFFFEMLSYWLCFAFFAAVVAGQVAPGSPMHGGAPLPPPTDPAAFNMQGMAGALPPMPPQAGAPPPSPMPMGAGYPPPPAMGQQPHDMGQQPPQQPQMGMPPGPPQMNPGAPQVNPGAPQMNPVVPPQGVNPGVPPTGYENQQMAAAPPMAETPAEASLINFD